MTYFNDQQVQKLLNISRTTLYRYRKDGLLNYVRVRGKIIYTQQQIEQFISLNSTKFNSYE
jgi:predicted site-specific integrase-resolvase